MTKVKLLRAGGYTGLEACIGKEFTALSDGNSNGSVRITVAQLKQAGFVSDGTVTSSLYFFGWEVEVIDG